MQTCIGIRSGISSSDCILFESILFHLNQLKQVQTRFQDQLMQLSPSDGDDVEIRNEISQLKQRLAGTDQELQRTNLTLRFILKNT